MASSGGGHGLFLSGGLFQCSTGQFNASAGAFHSGPERFHSSAGGSPERPARVQKRKECIILINECIIFVIGVSVIRGIVMLESCDILWFLKKPKINDYNRLLYNFRRALTSGITLCKKLFSFQKLFLRSDRVINSADHQRDSLGLHGNRPRRSSEISWAMAYFGGDGLSIQYKFAKSEADTGIIAECQQ